MCLLYTNYIYLYIYCIIYESEYCRSEIEVFFYCLVPVGQSTKATSGAAAAAAAASGRSGSLSVAKRMEVISLLCSSHCYLLNENM